MVNPSRPIEWLATIEVESYCHFSGCSTFFACVLHVVYFYYYYGRMLVEFVIAALSLCVGSFNPLGRISDSLPYTVSKKIDISKFSILN